MRTRTAVIMATAVAIVGVFHAPWLRAQAPSARGAIGPAFDVVSIKPSTFPSDAFFDGFLAGGGGPCAASQLRIAGNRVAFMRVTLCKLIQLAYDVHSYEIAGQLAWMTNAEPSIFYDIDARSTSGVDLTPEHAREMLKTMLAERFRLVLHHERRPLPVYALVVGRNGPHFAVSSEKFVNYRGDRVYSGSSGTAYGRGSDARGAVTWILLRKMVRLYSMPRSMRRWSRQRLRKLREWRPRPRQLSIGRKSIS